MAEEEQKKKKGPPTETLPNNQLFHLLGFGTYKIQDEQTMTALLRKGLQLGYCKHIDTARSYNNQIILGKAIQTVIKQDRVKREDLFIATKAFNYINEDPVLALKESLQLMQLDYVDVYYLHWPLIERVENSQKWLHRGLEECWEKFELCVKKGYAKHLGISNFNGQLLNDLLTFCKIKPIVLQIEAHPYLMQQNLVDIAQRNGVHVLAHTPLGRGESQSEENNVLKEDIIQQLAQKHGKTPAQIVLKANLHRKVGVIPKTSNLARLQENWESWTVELSQEDMKKIRNIQKKVRICDGQGRFNEFNLFDN